MSVIDDVGYDPDLLDAEILVDRATTEDSFDKGELGAYFGRSKIWVERGMKRGTIPRPAREYDHAVGEPARWSREQLIEIVAGRLERGEEVPR